jgi:enterochelin esterase family protein
MNTKTIVFLFIAVNLIGICNIATGQPPRGPWVVSPQVNPDKTVTFRYLAPRANEVKLNAQFEKAPVAMTKGEQGIWSVTVGPVKPDIYPYSFIVDGVIVMDPANEDYFPNERFKASLADIPGDTPLIHSLQDVPHGTITYEYYATAEGTTGSLVIYTPPGYDTNASEKYPVFYLISGTTDTEETWFKVGKANLILDNLIAEGKARPMIIVMPYGNVAATVAAQKGMPKPQDPRGRESADAIKRSKMFESDLLDNIIPYVESNYRTISNGDNRAIGGFSRGGGQTLRIALGNMDKFSWICCYSAYLTNQEIETNFPSFIKDADHTNSRLKLLWVSVGSEDFLYNQTVEFMDFLKAGNIQFKSMITPGGHTWMNTKVYLTETAKLLFQ